MAIGDKLFVADKPTLDDVKALVQKIDEVAAANPAAAGSLAEMLQTLTARLTSERAANLDNLDAPISGISGGVDWSSKTPKITQRCFSSAFTVVDITGSGYLKSVCVIGGSTGDIVIIIDGTTVFKGYLGGNDFDGWGSGTLVPDARFNSSLTVKKEDETNDAVRVIVSYMLD